MELNLNTYFKAFSTKASFRIQKSLSLNSLHTIIARNGEIRMDISEQRVIGSLLLLLGVTFLIVGLYSGQLEFVLKIVKRIFEASVAGLP
jgi:hypothetical protein